MLDRSILRSIYSVLEKSSSAIMAKAEAFKRPSLGETLANINPAKTKKPVYVRPHTTPSGPVKGHTRLQETNVEQAPVQSTSAMPTDWTQFNSNGKGVTLKGKMDQWKLPKSGFVLDAISPGTFEDQPVAKWTMDPDTGDLVLSATRRGSVHAEMWINAHGGRNISPEDQERFKNVVRGFYGKAKDGTPMIVMRTHSLDKEKSFNEQYKAFERLKASGNLPANAEIAYDAGDAVIRDALGIGPLEKL